MNGLPTLQLACGWRCLLCSTATNPKMKKKAKESHGFKVTSDGRLIIKDDDDEEDDVKKGRRSVKEKSDAGSDLAARGTQFIQLKLMFAVDFHGWLTTPAPNSPLF